MDLSRPVDYAPPRVGFYSPQPEALFPRETRPHPRARRGFGGFSLPSPEKFPILCEYPEKKPCTPMMIPYVWSQG